MKTKTPTYSEHKAQLKGIYHRAKHTERRSMAMSEWDAWVMTTDKVESKANKRMGECSQCGEGDICEDHQYIKYYKMLHAMKKPTRLTRDRFEERRANESGEGILAKLRGPSPQQSYKDQLDGIKTRAKHTAFTCKLSERERRDIQSQFVKTDYGESEE